MTRPNFDRTEALEQLASAYRLLLEFDRTIQNACGGDHPALWDLQEWLDYYDTCLPD